MKRTGRKLLTEGEQPAADGELRIILEEHRRPGLDRQRRVGFHSRLAGDAVRPIMSAPNDIPRKAAIDDGFVPGVIPEVVVQFIKQFAQRRQRPESSGD